MKTTTRLMAIVLVLLMAIGMYPQIFVSGVPEVEPNDGYGTANVLAPGVKTSGSVNSTDTADFYKFNVVNGENISIKLESDGDHLWGVLEDPTHTQLISDTGYTVIGVPTYANWTTIATVQGFYYFIVKTNQDGFYNLTLTITEPNDAGLGIDGGDNFPTATLLTNGTYHGWIGDSDKADYYKFVLGAAQIININFSVGTVGTEHLYAILYDSTQSSIHDLDWVEPGLTASYMYMTSALAAGSSCYIKVGDGQNNVYTLKVQLTNQNDAGIGHDASDTDTAPVMVTSGTLYHGAIGDKDEKDIYGFNVANGSIITVFMKTGIKGLNGIEGEHLYNKLYNPTKSQLVDSDWIEADLSTTYNWTTAVGQPGIYYIIVLGGYNTYSFRVTMIPQNDAGKGVDAGDTFPGLTVAPGNNYHGWFKDDDNKDYYNVNLTHGQMLTLNLTVGTTNSANKQYIRLYDASKTQVAEMADMVSPGVKGTLLYTSSYETPGIYYFLIDGSDNDYTFDVAIKNQTDAGTQIDAPEAFEHAINLKTGTYNGWMADSDKTDMYNISVKSNNVFTVNFTTGSGGTSSMYVDIYDPAKAKLETLTSAPDVKDTYTLPANKAPLTNSLFYLKVYGGDDKNYRLDVYLPELPPDTVPPVVAIATPANGAAFKVAAITVTGTATDVGGTIAKVEWSLNNSTYNNCTGGGAWTCAVTLTGANTVTIRATDSSGNKGYKALTTLSFDGTVPAVNVTLVDGSKVSKSKLTITGTSSDNTGISKVEVQVNGGTWITATGTTAWSVEVDLKTGTNTIIVRVTDTAGNTVDKTTTVSYKKSTSGGKGFIPGFEGAIFIAAALVGLVVLSRRKMN